MIRRIFAIGFLAALVASPVLAQTGQINGVVTDNTGGVVPGATVKATEAATGISRDTISGAEAAQIGLAMKSVPADMLEAEVEGLLDRLTLIDPHLLAANKRIVNLGLELMGARTLQRLAAENDARAHLAPGTRAYYRDVAEMGLTAAIKHRDAPFGDGRARVNGPEQRDERGFLV